MKRQLVVLLAVLVSVGFVGVGPATATHGQSTECSFQVTETDASGTQVTVDEEPDSVVALQPSAAQTMFEIGAQDKVVGMPLNAYTSYLNGTEDKTNVLGEQSTVLQEEVLDLDPDVVLAPNVTNAETVQSLRNSGLTVYYFEEAKSLDDVYDKTVLTGHLVGECDGATQRTETMRSEVESVRNAVAGEDRPTVLYSLGGEFTAGNQTFIHELITTAGGENVASSVGISGYKPISTEVIVQQNPDWIVIPAGRALPAGEAVNSTTAIRDDQIIRVNDNYMNQPAPRNTIPLRQMAEAFHPDAFDIDGTTTTETPGENTTADATDTPDEGGPGFTAVVALVALSAFVLLGRRTDL